MEIGKTLYCKNRGEWRAWLKKHSKTEKEIWLIYYRKATGKPRIPYNDAVEEALCFGWIDSIAKRIDEEKYAQRFSPRRKGSMLSQMNKERIRKMIKEGKMTDAGLEAVKHAFDAITDREDDFEIPAEILAEIKKDGAAWENFKNFPEGYKRIRIAYIESQGFHSRVAYERSLRHFIRMTARNKRFGFIRN
ncbi:MAG: YdeI/OmpD-associated family protein [Candidatus Micrarchaeota archaeon]